MGGVDTEPKLEPYEEKFVNDCPNESTPFVFTCGIQKHRRTGLILMFGKIIHAYAASGILGLV